MGGWKSRQRGKTIAKSVSGISAKKKIALVVTIEDAMKWRIVPKSMAFSDTVLMELPAGLHGKQQFDE